MERSRGVSLRNACIVLLGASSPPLPDTRSETYVQRADTCLTRKHRKKRERSLTRTWHTPNRTQSVWRRPTSRCRGNGCRLASAVAEQQLPYRPRTQCNPEAQKQLLLNYMLTASRSMSGSGKHSLASMSRRGRCPIFRMQAQLAHAHRMLWYMCADEYPM